MAKKRQAKDESDLVRRDGAVALTFVNTGSRRSPPLRDYTDLVQWALENGVLSAADASRLGKLAAERPEAGAAAFTVAREVHSLLSRIMNARADYKAPPPEAVVELNATLSPAVPRRILVPGRSRMTLGWPEDPDKEVYRPAVAGRPVGGGSPDLGGLRQGDALCGQGLRRPLPGQESRTGPQVV